MEGRAMGVLSEKLPEEVMHDILFRLPIKNIVRFRCVSKSWLHLLSFDPQFKKLYSQANKNNRDNPPGIVALSLRRRKPKLYYAQDYAACDKAIEFDLPFNKPSNGHYFIFGICNGLICFSLHKISDDDCENLANVYVWNPLTGDHITIPFPTVSSWGPAVSTSFGFGYHEGSDEYKVVRVSWSSSKVLPQVSVYTLGTPSWRFLNYIRYDVSSHNSHVPLVNGALHWVANTLKLPSSKTIISFDVKDEVFQEIPLPSVVKYDNLSKIRVGEFCGLLCVSYAHNHGLFELWVMKEYGVADSWIKHCDLQRVELDLRRFRFSDFIHFEPLGRGRDQDIIMRTSPWDLSLYNSENSTLTKLKMFKIRKCVCALFTYIGGLTSPKRSQLNQ